jgi:hypothetical protein
LEKRKMRKYALLFLALVIVAGVSGCVEEVGKGIEEFTGGLFESNPKAEATIAEINAVAKLKSDAQMEEGFKAIASRKGISVAPQVHLVDPVINKLYYETAKVEVLLLLVNNPDFCHQAKKKILERLGKLKSESSKSKIIKAINKRVIGVKNNIPPVD